MDTTKEYINRYGDKYTFSLNEQGNVDWRGSFEKMCRVGYDKDSNDIIMVDPSGGPYIAIGYPLEVAGIDRKVVGFKDHTTYWEILLDNIKEEVIRNYNGKETNESREVGQGK